MDINEAGAEDDKVGATSEQKQSIMNYHLLGLSPQERMETVRATVRKTVSSFPQEGSQ